MYGGVAAETPATDAAVAATTGQIVAYRGVPAITYFSASSGGHTENVENLWPRATAAPWLRGAPDPYDGVAGNPYHRWVYDLSLGAAASKLGSLVKGNLIGVQAVKLGVSKRIVAADVVGTKGRTRVTGSELQQVFGLRSTWVTFTTISTSPTIPTPSTAPAAAKAAESDAQLFTDIGLQARLALAPLVEDLIGGTAAGLHGAVFPAPAPAAANAKDGRGATVAIQVSAGHKWRTVSHARLSAAGTYTATLSGPGTYRVVYQGLAGPAVTVS
jgi:stage II sporulation protein D